MGGKPKVLVVDDEDRNVRLLEAMLVPLGYTVSVARNGEEALAAVGENPPDVILLDVMMPRMDGFEVVGRLKSNEATKIIPVVMVTSLHQVEDRVRALEAGADDFLSKPVDKAELQARVSSLLKVKAYNDQMRNYQQQLEAEVENRTVKLVEAFEKIRTAALETVVRLSRAAEYRDEDTGAHIQRMSNYCATVAREMGLPDETVSTILYASPMHDIGKIGIPDRILLKPGKLDAVEWEIMNRHTLFGGRILDGSDASVLRVAQRIALTHHERWDGTGYPRGLKGKKIPLTGRITAIADVFDALTSKRPYKEAFSVEKSLRIIQEDSDTHFDPDVVKAFFASQNQILFIMNAYKSEGPSILVQITDELG